MTIDDLAGRFRLVEPTRTGGMATVWRATDLATGADVAVKVLSETTSDETVARFDREARLLAAMDHDAIVRYVAHGRTRSGRLNTLATVDFDTLAAAATSSSVTGDFMNRTLAHNCTGAK